MLLTAVGGVKPRPSEEIDRRHLRWKSGAEGAIITHKNRVGGMEPKKITARKLEQILTDLTRGEESAIGTYLYRGMRVQISKYGASGSERFARLYRRRRSQGLCVVCGARVTTRNPRTARPYRLCDLHRASIDHKTG